MSARRSKPDKPDWELSAHDLQSVRDRARWQRRAWQRPADFCVCVPQVTCALRALCVYAGCSSCW